MGPSVVALRIFPTSRTRSRESKCRYCHSVFLKIITNNAPDGLLLVRFLEYMTLYVRFFTVAVKSLKKTLYCHKWHQWSVSMLYNSRVFRNSILSFLLLHRSTTDCSSSHFWQLLVLVPPSLTLVQYFWHWIGTEHQKRFRSSKFMTLWQALMKLMPGLPTSVFFVRDLLFIKFSHPPEIMNFDSFWRKQRRRRFFLSKYSNAVLCWFPSIFEYFLMTFPEMFVWL